MPVPRYDLGGGGAIDEARTLTAPLVTPPFLAGIGSFDATVSVAGLDGCMSMLPRKCAPSAIATLGDAMSPSTDPFARISSFSVAVMLPVTLPTTTTDFALTCALICPFGPIVSVSET